jgi:hypothetical protein
MKSDGAMANNHAVEREIVARQGLRLPAITLNRLRSAGIYCQPTVSTEHQQVAKRHVLRGVESGGAIAELGAYCSFVDEHGNALSWLQRIDSIGVNGVHAIVVAPVFVRVQMLRIQRTYDLLISRHSLSATEKGRRPRLESLVIFHGRRGSLEMDLWHEEARFRGAVCPVFFSRSGEVMALPGEFQNAATLITAAVCCIGCHHCHLLQPKRIVTSDDPFVIGAIAGE